jgi:hypothetical protein
VRTTKDIKIIPWTLVGVVVVVWVQPGMSHNRQQQQQQQQQQQHPSK